MESFLWTRGVESIIREEELSTCSGEVIFDAYLQLSGGQTSVQCSESDLQSVDQDRRANPAAQRGPGSKRLKMQLMTDNVNFNISHELTGNNSIHAFGRTINHPEKQLGCTAVAHLTRINVHPSEIKSALRKETTDTHRDGIDLSLIHANAGPQVLYKNTAISDTGVHYLYLIDSIFLC